MQRNESCCKIMQNYDTEEQNGEVIYKISTKLLLVLTFVCMGIYRHIPGTTLLDMSERVNQDLLKMPLLYTARAVGYIVGCVAGTFLFEKFLHSNQITLLYFLTVFLMSVTAFSISLSDAFLTLLLSFCASGVCMAAFDAGINIMSLHCWEKLGTQFLQSLHIFYAVGFLIAPFVTRTYLKSVSNITLETPYHRENTDNEWHSYYMPSVIHPYIILSSLIFFTSLLWLAMFCFNVVNPLNLFDNDSEIIESDFKNCELFNTSILTFLCACLDFSYIQILPVYCVIVLNMTQVKSTEVMATFLGFFTAGRIICFSISGKFKPHNILFPSILMAFIGAVFLFLYLYHGEIFFWTANAMLGLGSSPLFPLVMTWLSEHVIITHRSVLPLYLAAALCELVMPLIMSHLLWRFYSTIAVFVLAVSVSYFVHSLCQYFLIYTRKKALASEELVSPPAELPVVTVKDLYGIGAKQISPKEESHNKDVDPSGVFERIKEVKNRIDTDNKEISRTLKQLEFKSLQVSSEIASVSIRDSERNRDKNPN